MKKKDEVYVAGNTADFPPGSHRVVKVGRRDIGIFNVNGRFHGLPNLCPHQTGPLCAGIKNTTGALTAPKENDWRFQWVHEGEIVACPWHGLEYHVPTGQCLAYRNVRLRTYDVFVEDDEVKVRL